MPEQAAPADNTHLARNSPYSDGRNPIYRHRTEAAQHARWDWSKKDFRRIIATSKIIKRLQAHSLGHVEMQNSAVRAAIALLDRVLPALQSVEVKAEHTHRYVLEVPQAALSSAEWEAIDTKLTPALPSPTKAKATSKA